MISHIDIITKKLATLSMSHLAKTKYAIRIQKVFRGYITRAKRLPLIMYYLHTYLKKNAIKLTTTYDEGRINSYVDETRVISLLRIQFGEKIKLPNSRMWYDMLVFDYI